MKKVDDFRCVFPLVITCVVLMVVVPMTQLAMGQNQTTTPTTKLRIAVPVREINKGFVDIERDPITGDQNVSGFAIEVFKAVVNRGLSYSVSFELIPFAKPDNTLNGTFDDMLRAVSSQAYDGAVGDIIIQFYRTEWVDFTSPYMESGISMLVPLRQQQQLTSSKRGGIPLVMVIKGIVAATLAFSFIVALVFWILEYRNDKRYADASLPHPSTVDDDKYWRREMLGSIIQTRLVMVLLFMVLLILIACYTASQTSSLTARDNIPIKNLNQLIRMKENVGYATGSFIRNLLIQKGIPESRLMAFHSDQDMAEMLSKGTARGGIGAVVAITPFLKNFLANRCHEFAMVPTVNLLTAGFGFAFRKGSPYAKDFSLGIVRLIDNGLLPKIRERTIGSLETCQDDPTALDFDSLWILIAAAIAVFLLMIIILLLYCGVRRNTRKKRAIAFPCYLLPCC